MDSFITRKRRAAESETDENSKAASSDCDRAESRSKSKRTTENVHRENLGLDDLPKDALEPVDYFGAVSVTERLEEENEDQDDNAAIGVHSTSKPGQDIPRKEADGPAGKKSL